MSSSRKRKNRPGKAHKIELTEADIPPEPVLFIQAHEADILRGPQAKRAADCLEVSDAHMSLRPDSRQLGGLIRWDGPSVGPAPAFPSDADDAFPEPETRASTKPIWVDRYDARLLLDALPEFAPSGEPDSPSGWSDLPSDAEDTFFFSPSETEDYRQEKRRRLMDRTREDRLKARKAEDGDTADEDVWGGSDEEPDEAQAMLMKRTASSLSSTTNPAQLEMRILANHGADKRFAFLRGRWKKAWNSMKREARVEVEKKEAAKTSAGGLGNLADYGDSDDESQGDPPPDLPSEAGEDILGAVIAARQARAKAWAATRRALKE